MTDLFEPHWHLDDLTDADFGPFGRPEIVDETAPRTPVVLGTNNRVAMLDHRIDSGDLTYQKVFSDPIAMLKAELLHKYVMVKRYNHFCDGPTALPEDWPIGISFQNVYEAWYLGCQVDFKENQVPDTTPILNEDNKRSIFDIDIDKPLEKTPFKTAIEFYDVLVEYVKDKTFLDRPIQIVQPLMIGTDGPLTVAMNIRGGDILFEMIEDPEYAAELFTFINEAAIKRAKAMIEHFGSDIAVSSMADDSIAMISVEQYREMLLPLHRRWYEAFGSTPGARGIHLCGDATHHFPMIHQELGVTYFDTGYPIDFADMRNKLGDDVTISGGVEVDLLVNGTPQSVYERGRDILTSGVKRGGKFTFREANNLPPNCPWQNLSAFYHAGIDFGRHDT